MLVTSGRCQEKRGELKRNRCIDHFYSLAVEAGLYGDVGRVGGSFYEVKWCTWGWVTAVVDSVEDPDNLHLVAMVGLEMTSTSSPDPDSQDRCPWQLLRPFHRVCMVDSVRDLGAKSRKDEETCKGI